MSYRFAINATLAHRLLPCVSKEKTRYYLNGVGVDFSAKEGARLVATDGLKMGIFADRAAFGESDGVVIVARFVLEEGYKAATKASKGYRFETPMWIVIEGENTKATKCRIVTAPTADEALSGVPTDSGFIKTLWISTEDTGLIDGTFPDYSRIVPSKIETENHINAAWNPAYLGAFERVLLGDRREVKTMHLVPTSRGGAFLVLDSRAPDFLGVIMPCRETDIPTLHAAARNVLL